MGEYTAELIEALTGSQLAMEAYVSTHNPYFLARMAYWQEQAKFYMEWSFIPLCDQTVHALESDPLEEFSKSLGTWFCLDKGGR